MHGGLERQASVRDDISPRGLPSSDRTERLLPEGDSSLGLLSAMVRAIDNAVATKSSLVTTFLNRAQSPRLGGVDEFAGKKLICRTFCTGKSRCKWAPPPITPRATAGGAHRRSRIQRQRSMSASPCHADSASEHKTVDRRRMTGLGISVYRFKGVVVALVDRHNGTAGSAPNSLISTPAHKRLCLLR